MSSILKSLRVNRRDCVWFFILGLLSLGYTWVIAEGAQFLVDNNAPPLTTSITSGTVIILGAIFGVIGGLLLICGLSVIVTGGSSEL